MTVLDLLIAGQPGPEVAAGTSKWHAERLTASVDVPPRAVLVLRASLGWQPGHSGEDVGPVTFAVEVDGERLHESELRTPRLAYEATVPLDGFAGRRVDVVARIDNGARETTVAYWRDLRMDRLEAVPRRRAAAGQNLLLVLVDTLRADHCSLYGYERPTTPRLDAFAEQALVYEQAIAPASWTLPSVASILTGTSPPRHAAVRNGGLRDPFRTLAERLQAVGLTTLGVSANPIIGPAQGFDQGFETFHHAPWARAEEVNRTFQGWLDGREDLQWFAYLHYVDPHDPYDAPGADGETWTDAGYDGVFRRAAALDEYHFTKNYGLEPPFEVGGEDLRFLVDGYDGEIRHWDRFFGRLLDDLQERGLLDRTTVIVTSDHGEEFLDHGMVKHGYQLYAESIRVPLVIRAPELGAGRIQANYSLIRLLSGIRELFGLDAKPGRKFSFRTARPRHSVFSFVRYTIDPEDHLTRRTLAALHTSDLKLHYRPDDGSTELYRLSDDPREERDLSRQHPELAERMREVIDRWIAEESANAPSSGATVDLVDELRALGYIQ